MIRTPKRNYDCLPCSVTRVSFGRLSSQIFPPWTELGKDSFISKLRNSILILCCFDSDSSIQQEFSFHCLLSSFVLFFIWVLYIKCSGTIIEWVKYFLNLFLYVVPSSCTSFQDGAANYLLAGWISAYASFKTTSISFAIGTCK